MGSSPITPIGIGIGIVVIIILAVIFTSPQPEPKVAKFIQTDITTPNFLDPQVKAGEYATITVNVANISAVETIDNVWIKVYPKVSKNGEFLQVIEKTTINVSIAAGGTSGPKDIRVNAIKPPTSTATETIVLELYVGDILQESKTLSLKIT